MRVFSVRVFLFSLIFVGLNLITAGSTNAETPAPAVKQATPPAQPPAAAATPGSAGEDDAEVDDGEEVEEDDGADVSEDDGDTEDDAADESEDDGTEAAAD